MKTIPQKMAMAAGGVTLLAVATVGATLLLVHPEDYRDRFIASVKQQTGADLTLSQPLHWQLWPLGFQTDAIALGAGGTENLLEAGHVAASLKITSLLSGQPSFSGLAFTDAKIQLMPQGEGWNWSGVLQKLGASPATTGTALSFSNSSLLWKTAADSKAREISFNRFDLQAGQGGQQDLQADFTYSHQDEAGNNLLLQNTLKGRLQHAGSGTLKLSGTQLNSAVSSTRFPGNLDLVLQGDAELAAGRLKIPGALLQGSYKSLGMEHAYAMTVKADAGLDIARSQLSLQKLATVSAGDSIAAETLLADWQNGRVTAGKLKLTHAQDKRVVTLTTELDANLPQGRIGLSAFELALPHSKAQGMLNATLPFLAKGLLSSAGNPWEGLKLEGRLTADPVDMTELLALAGQTSATGKTGARQGTLEARMEGQGDQFYLRDIRLKTADGTITGEAGVSSLASTPHYVLRLRADRLDLDALLPAAGKTALPDIGKVRNRNFDISLQVASLQALSQSWTNAQLEAKAAAGQLDVTALRATSGKGRLSLPFTLGAADTGNVITAKPDIQNIDIARLTPLLGDKKLTGQFSSQGSIQFSGNTVQDWQKTASGTLSFRLENGSSPGNLMKGILEKMQGYKSLLPELAVDVGTLATGDKTDIVLLDTDNSFSQGIITTRLKALDLGRARLHGDGHFDANQQTLDYGITLSLDKSVFAAKDKGMDMPMQCKANLVEEQTDFFSALGDDCKMSEDAMHDILSRALTRRFRDS